MLQEKVIGVDFSQWPRTVTTLNLNDPTRTTTWRALSVIIAMGKEPHLLGVPGEQGSLNYWGKGISNCAPCDGALYKNEDVIVVGGGDAAIAEAAYLADIARTVTIVVRKDHLKTKDLKAQERVVNRPNVKVLFNTQVKAVEGDGKHVTHVVTLNNTTQQQGQLKTSGVFLAIGSGPNTLLFRNILELDAQGFIVLKNYQETSVPGIYAAGDIANSVYSQAIIASGDGCKAALQSLQFLRTNGFEASMVKHNQPVDQTILTHTPAGSISEITSAKDFDRLVINAHTPVIIDVYATLCISCQKLLPTLEHVAAATKGKIAFVKLTMSTQSLESNKLIARLGGTHIHTVPTLIFVKNGREVGRLADTCTANELHKKIIEYFGK
jgi:thioredoxin reductase (NADPH)